MRKFILAIAVFTSLQLAAQNNDYLIKMDGIGNLKLDMTQSEIEKVLGKKINLKNPADDENYWADTVATKYKNTDITLYFEKLYDDSVNSHMALMGMRVTNPLYKTVAGIGIGADKLKIITTYEMSRLNIMPEYTDDTYTTLSKTLSSIWVNNDDSETTLVFYLKNKKVFAIDLARYAEGD
jgi:hypothetical protein